MLLDSMAALGVISKGRSSSPPLLRLARQLAAYCISFGFLLYPRYIPSEINPADGPSRGQAVGAADETRAAHADRLGQTLARAREQETARDRDVPEIAPATEVARHLAGARACAGFAGG